MQDLTEKYPELDKLLTDACGEFGERVADDSGFEPMVDKVSARSYDGFIAHTNGGVRVMVPRSMEHHYQNTGKEAEILEPYVESALRDCAAAFIANNETLKAAREADASNPPSDIDWLHDWLNAHEERLERQADMLGAVPFYMTDVGKLRESYHDFEHEYLAEGGTYWLCLTVLFYAADHYRNRSNGRDEIFLFAGVNTDFEYGRDKYLESSFEQTVPVDELNAEKIAELIDAAIASFV